MQEMSLEYWNKLANQIIVIGSLLGGFSIVIVVNLLVSETNNRLARTIMKAAVLAAGFFLVSLFAMTKALMMTTRGFPSEMSKAGWTAQRNQMKTSGKVLETDLCTFPIKNVHLLCYTDNIAVLCTRKSTDTSSKSNPVTLPFAFSGSKIR